LDEADRLLDMGFERDLKAIVAALDAAAAGGNAAAAATKTKAKYNGDEVEEDEEAATEETPQVGAGDAPIKRKPSDKPRQNILVSATLEERINSLAAVALRNPVAVGFQGQDSYLNEQEKLKLSQQAEALMSSSGGKKADKATPSSTTTTVKTENKSMDTNGDGRAEVKNSTVEPLVVTLPSFAELSFNSNCLSFFF
jgi:superfamily II DNA/RNA helicase